MVQEKRIPLSVYAKHLSTLEVMAITNSVRYELETNREVDTKYKQSLRALLYKLYDLEKTLGL